MLEGRFLHLDKVSVEQKSARRIAGVVCIIKSGGFTLVKKGDEGAGDIVGYVLGLLSVTLHARDSYLYVVV